MIVYGVLLVGVLLRGVVWLMCVFNQALAPSLWGRKEKKIKISVGRQHKVGLVPSAHTRITVERYSKCTLANEQITCGKTSRLTMRADYARPMEEKTPQAGYITITSNLFAETARKGMW